MRYAIFSIIFIAVIGVGSFYYVNFKSSSEPEDYASKVGVDEIDVNEATIEELFEQGQYYFNHNENSDGSYDLDKARYYYEQILKRQPDGHELAWYQLGRIDFLEGKFDLAIEKFNNQIKYFGDRVPNVYYMIGLTYGYKARASVDADDWQKGEAGFSKFLEFVPTSPWAITDLTWLYFAQGKYEEMKPILEEGLQYEPDSPWLHNMYGLALLNTENKAEALKHFKLAADSASKLTVVEWGRAYPGNDPKFWREGLDSFQRAINANILLAEDEG